MLGVHRRVPAGGGRAARRPTSDDALGLLRASWRAAIPTCASSPIGSTCVTATQRPRPARAPGSTSRSRSCRRTTAPTWHGRSLSWLVVFLQRPGGQSQFSERLSVPTTTNAHVRTLLDEIAADPAADHRQARLARRVSLSERHLRRVFLEQTHTTPARFVERVRVERARAMLDHGSATIEAVARRSGFGSPETMRRAFIRVIGIAPADYRERFQAADHLSPAAARARSTDGRAGQPAR